MKIMIFFNLTSPLLMMWIGSILARVQISDMNSGQGYRGPMAMRSQEHWDYGQKIAPEVYKGYGLTGALIVFLWDISVLAAGLDEMMGMLAGIVVAAIIMAAAGIKIEKLIYEECGE